MSETITPTLHDIVKAALEKGGYEGLFSSCGRCACEMADLFPCDAPSGACRAGYKIKCPGDDCTLWAEPLGDHHWHIVETKPEGKP